MQDDSRRTMIAPDDDMDGEGDSRLSPASSPTFSDLAAARYRRREVLAGGLAAAVSAFFAPALAGRIAVRGAATGLLGFRPVPVGKQDAVAAPPGYRVQVLAPFGQPIDGSSPDFSLRSDGAAQASQVGSHHDGMHFFALDGRSDDGLLVVNHEYVEPRFMHAAYAGRELGSNDVLAPDDSRDADEVLKEVNAHGISVLRIACDADGSWRVRPDPRNRRITGRTPMAFAGPVRGSALLRTKYSPEGIAVRGTLSNCAHGVTPWNSYLAAEENWAGYFRNGDRADGKPRLPREQARYGVRTGAGRFRWEQAAGGADEFVRFDASTLGPGPEQDYRNEPNGFGWVVEIDPFDPDSVPVKRTALGRFAHEGVVFAPTVPGRPVVCYSGDDAPFEYIYKFVSAAPFDPATASGALLDQGVLYVARFEADGSGRWLPLVYGQEGLNAANGFASQADILVNTRLAADLVGATPMDRPEWGAVDPSGGEVYFSLSHNRRRTEAQVDGPNPRAGNIFGQILRWNERDGADGTRLSWELFILAGDRDSSRTFAGAPLDEAGIFACPDGLWFDPDGRLWIQTDIGNAALNRGKLAPFGNNQMLAADPRTGEVRRFLTGPVGQEITGIVTTPDGRTMFVNVQHPGATTTKEDFAAGRLASHWPDGGDAVPRSACLAITRRDGGRIGT